MKVALHIGSSYQQRYLRDFIRLVFGFYACLLLSGLYQQFRLYDQGILDAVFTRNLVLLWIHHAGYASLASLVFAFVFSRLEKFWPGWGFRAAIGFFMFQLAGEVVLTEYFVRVYDLPDTGFGGQLANVLGARELLTIGGIALLINGVCFYLVYRSSKRFYRAISRMYPVTLVLLSLFLATAWTERKPVNLNKMQYLAGKISQHWFQGNAYRGSDPYPLYSAWSPEDPFGSSVLWPETPPDIVILAIEGLSSDFVGERAPLRGFTPFLDSLRHTSLYWPDYLSNVRGSAAVPLLISGSLPQGSDGFLAGAGNPNSLTLFSLLRQNGYRTSFQYGGNSVLYKWDRFFHNERVDELSDQQAFGPTYTKQDADAAGISLGYPDEALFDRYLHSRDPGDRPRLDLLQTLSASAPFRIPDAAGYMDKVSEIREQSGLTARYRRIADRNEKLLAALHYTDRQLRNFFKMARASERFDNTLFVITGTHRPTELGTIDPLGEYRVPLLVYSPMLRKPGIIKGPASHMDLAPSLLGALSERYGLKLPGHAAWLGGPLTPGPTDQQERAIPLYRDNSGLRGLVSGNWLLSDGKTYEIGPGGELTLPENGSGPDIETKFEYREAVERYVIEENALIPAGAAPYEPLVRPLDNRDLAWVHSVFNGKDMDDAYGIARDLAIGGQRERAARLCRYILSRAPAHADTEILLGRIYAWDGAYEKAAELLNRVTLKYPLYEDGYAALLDVYYWAGRNDEAPELESRMDSSLENSRLLREKFRRAALANSGPGPVGNTRAANRFTIDNQP